MKSLIIFIVFFALVPNVLAQTNANDFDSLIVGNWKVDYAQTVAHMTSGQLQIYDSLSEAQREIVAQRNEQRVYEFKSDATLKITQPGTLITGTWEFDANNSQLEITLSSGAVLNFTVELIEANLIKLHTGSGENEKRYIWVTVNN